MLLATIALSRRKAIFFLLITALLVIMVVSPPKGVIERATYTAKLAARQHPVPRVHDRAVGRQPAWKRGSSPTRALSQYPFAGAGVTGFGLIDAQYPGPSRKLASSASPVHLAAHPNARHGLPTAASRHDPS